MTTKDKVEEKTKEYLEGLILIGKRIEEAEKQVKKEQSKRGLFLGVITFNGEVVSKKEWVEIEVLEDAGDMVKIRFIGKDFKDKWTEKSNIKFIK
jgi:hypothetical protein